MEVMVDTSDSNQININSVRFGQRLEV